MLIDAQKDVYDTLVIEGVKEYIRWTLVSALN